MRATTLLSVLLMLPACGGMQSADTTRFAPTSLTDPGEGEGEDESDDGTWEPDDTGAPDDEEPDDEEPDDEEPEPVVDVDACYLGAARDGLECLSLVELSPTPSDYVYPSPLNGNAQYAAPLRFLDLDLLDGALKLAPNFRLDEIAQAWKGRYAVVQSHAITALQTCRDEVGPIVVNSGYRNVSYNAGVGGATWSRHMYGDAFDLAPTQVSLTAMADACTRNGAGFVSLYVSHVHCDWRDDALDLAFYGSARSGMWSFAESSLHEAEIAWDGPRLRAPATGFDEGEPLRQWIALDAHGVALDYDEGEDYLPPVDAVEVEVTVGGLVTLRRFVDEL